MKGMFGGYGGGQGCPGNNAWREKKARLVSSPQEALVGSPGEMIFANIEICNDN